MKPDVFIVGAPKCGTSAMAHYLAGHPDIFMARKEMHFFGSDLRFGAQFYRRDANAYLAEYNSWKGQSRAAEASVWYLFSKRAADEIQAFNPDARIIILVREPAEMLYSLYYQFRFDGNESLPTFEEALAAEDARRAGRTTGRRTYLAQGLLYHEVARYTEQIQRYLKVFGSERVKTVLYDDFASAPAAVYRGVLEFLDVDSTQLPSQFAVVNSNKAIERSLLMAFADEPLIRSAVIAMRSLLPHAVFSSLQKLESRVRRANTRPQERPPMSDDLKFRLKRDFTPEIERLGVLLNRDLSHWSN
jgi:hypothetical protein